MTDIEINNLVGPFPTSTTEFKISILKNGVEVVSSGVVSIPTSTLDGTTQQYILTSPLQNTSIGDSFTVSYKNNLENPGVSADITILNSSIFYNTQL